jgi:hypothetical protein
MIRFVLFFLIATFTFTACEEIGPEINPAMGEIDNPDTLINVDAQKRQVLIEEFTGVRCVQCPGGAAIIEDLLAIHGDQLVAVALHAGEWAPPFNESLYDFRTQDGDQVLNFLGEPIGYPSAVVNRKLFDGEFDLQLGKNQWAGFIALEAAEEPKVKIALQIEYDGTGRTLDADVTLFVQENILEPDVRLSVLITEDDIIDMQETPEGKKSDYKHKHVLRDYLSNYAGDPITSPMVAGAEINESFSIELKEDWVVDNINVVAFVHVAGASKEVLQAAEVQLND